MTAVHPEGAVRARWLSPEDAVFEIKRFVRRFGPKALFLASHAALPLILSPELLHLIRINFLEEEGIPAIAEADLLLSPLCRPLEDPLFEMEPRIREILLEMLVTELGETFGADRPGRVAQLLMAWLCEKPVRKRSDSENRSHEWVMNAWLNPEGAISHLKAGLKAVSDNDMRRADRLRLVQLAETLAVPLQEKAAEQYRQVREKTRETAEEVYGLKKKQGASAASKNGPRQGDIIELPVGKKSLPMRFVYIEPGEFMMGQSEEETKVLIEMAGQETYDKYYKRELPRHKVILTQGFYMQETPVTVGQWKEFVEAAGYITEAEAGDGAYVYDSEKNDWDEKKDANWRNPYFDQEDDHPVVCLSWNDAEAFVHWLNGKEDQYCLPTEAQWEYACRAMTDTFFWTGSCLNTDQANYDGNYPMKGCPKGKFREKTTPVTKFSPNPWGLYDMHGNAYEWCNDYFEEDYYQNSPIKDPNGPKKGRRRVLRGGSWDFNAMNCRSAGRSVGAPGGRNYFTGFRVLLRRAQ